MQNSESVLEIEEVHKSFQGVKVLNNLSLKVNKGERVAVIGASGSGKSTLLQCINRLVHVDKGKITVNEFEITNPKVDIKRARQEIGMVFQGFNLVKHLTVLDNVTLGLIKVKKMDKKRAVEHAKHELNRVGLNEHIKKYPTQLSGGQQQRVGIARALAMSPSLLLFDEPTSALDPSLTGEVLNVIEKLAVDEMTMVIVTHEMKFAKNVTNKVALVDQGEIVECGYTNEIFSTNNYPLIASFMDG